MKGWIKRCRILIVAFSIMALSPGLSQSCWDVLDSGGGMGSSPNYILLASIGQSVIGEDAEDSYALGTGYLYGIDGVIPEVDIIPVVTSPQSPGDEFWVAVQVGEVNDLFGVSFRLNYDTALLDVVTPYSANVLPGSMLGSDVLFIQDVDESKGHVNIGISRKAGDGGVSGYGTAAWVKFRLNPAATPTTTCLAITNVAAIDETGSTTISLCPQTACMEVVVLPDTPTLISPANGTMSVSTALDYQWSAIPGCTYVLQLDDDADFSSPAVVGTISSTCYNPGVYLPDATYYWRVKAVNEAGLMSRWSTIYSLKVTTVVLKPVYNPPQLAGDDFWVDVYATKTSNVVPTYYPMNDLFGLSFSLFYERTGILDVAAPIALSVEAGSFWGAEPIMLWNVEEDAGNGQGRIDIAICRKAGQDGSSIPNGRSIPSGISGYGKLIRVKFSTMPGTSSAGIRIKTSEPGYPISAYNSIGQPINIGAECCLLDINAPIKVWPGDTNNDGRVDAEDIFPIAVYYNQTGPTRPNASIVWSAQPMPAPWSPVEAAYADADGNGVVNATDVLAIGVNFGCTHTVTSGGSLSPALVAKADYAKYVDAFRQMYNVLASNGIATQGVSELKQMLSAVIETAVEQQELDKKPDETKLGQNYPNPFNPECWIPYELSEQAHVVIRIYNITGQLIKTLDEGVKESGAYTTQSRAAHWDGRNDEGDEVASGVYFYQLQVGNKTLTGRMVVLK